MRSGRVPSGGSVFATVVTGADSWRRTASGPVRTTSIRSSAVPAQADAATPTLTTTSARRIPGRHTPTRGRASSRWRRLPTSALRPGGLLGLFDRVRRPEVAVLLRELRQLAVVGVQDLELLLA